MATIRPYEPKDQNNLRMICIETGSGAAHKPGPAQTMLLATYCDYYAEREPEHCFVVANDSDEAVGYILCAPDYRKYRSRFLKDYAPRTKGTGLFQQLECYGAAYLPMLFRNYPAHLHIDILPEYQHRGFGTQLMNCLTDHLRRQGVAGVMLGVGAENKQGRSFYKKYGFKSLLRIPRVVVMGLALTK